MHVDLILRVHHSDLSQVFVYSFCLGEVSWQCQQGGFLVSTRGEDDLVGQTFIKPL